MKNTDSSYSLPFINHATRTVTGYLVGDIDELETELVFAINKLDDKRDPSGGLKALHSRILSFVQNQVAVLRALSDEVDFHRGNIFRYGRNAMLAQLKLVLVHQLNESRKRQPSENEADLWAIYATDLDFEASRTLTKQFKRSKDFQDRYMIDLRIDAIEAVCEMLMTE